MQFIFEERASASPLVETVWQTQSDQAGTFISLAVSHWEMVVTRYNGQSTFTLRGPETKATMAPVPENAEFFGIKFKPGTFMPHLSPKNLVDQGLNLPNAASQSFWLNSSTWQFPDYENVDTFIARLVNTGLLVYDPVVETVLRNQPPKMSLRSVQRRFLQATGLTHSTIRQIERALYAMTSLQQGVSILDVVDQAGYADQSHLTRSLKRFIGQTPTQITSVHQHELLESANSI